MLCSTELVEGAEVEHGLRKKDPRIEHIEGTDKRRDLKLTLKREAERLEVYLPPRLGNVSADVWQKVAQRDGTCTSRTAGTFLGQQHAEVAIKRTLDHLG